MRSLFDSTRAWLAPLVVFGAIVLVFGGFWLFFDQAERREHQQAMQLTADQAARRLESFIATRLQLVDALRRAIVSGAPDSRAEFRARAGEYHAMLDGIVAINWVDVDGVIREVVPHEPNRQALGNNLFEHPEAGPAIRAAGAGPNLYATPPLELYQGGTGFAVYGAVRRDQVLEGFVNAAFRVSPVVEQALRAADEPFRVAIVDGSRTVFVDEYDAVSRSESRISASTAVSVANRRWTLTLTPRAHVDAHFASSSNDLVLMLGVLLAAVVALLVRRLIGRSDRQRRVTERYRRLVEDMPALVSRWRPDTTLTFVNAAYAAHYGKQPEELVGRPYLELVPQAARAGILENVQSLVRGEQTLIASERVAVDAEGRQRWHDWRDGALTDAAGRVVEIQSIGIDTTESKEIKEALGMSEERFRTVFSSVTDAILILDEAGCRVVDVNDVGLGLHGVDREELVGARLFELIHGEPPAELLRWFEAAVATRVPIRLEWRATRGESLWWVDASLNMARIDGVNCVLCVVRDASEQKLLEEQLLQSQKMEAVGTLAGGLAHDVNNVLTAILGQAEQARSIVVGGTAVTNCLDAIVDVCRQAGSITRSLLTFSQRGSAEREPIDLRRAATHAVELLRPLLPDAIEVQLDGAAGAALWIDVDRTQLQQVVMNLVLNARDAMTDGGRLVVSVTSRDASDSQRAVLCVADDGRGMSAEVQRRVIEPFFTTKARGQGTGLGMSIVHGIVTRQGGLLSIDSEVDVGTKVTIELPRCAPPARAVELELVAAAASTVRPAQGTVLLIEDNLPVREVLARGLAAQGYEVLDEGDGEAGLRVFESEADRLSLVVVDVDLPRKGGPECVREMQQRRADVPTILISGNARHSINVDLGARVEFLQKPFRIAQLAELGQQMIDGADADEQP